MIKPTVAGQVKHIDLVSNEFVIITFLKVLFLTKIWANPVSFGLFSSFFVILQFKFKKQSIDVVLGIRTWAAGRQAKTDSLIYGAIFFKVLAD